MLNWSAISKNPNRKIVSTFGDFQTIKAAVDWFNANATANMEILIDAGIHLVSDTITINNASYSLQIRGLGSAVTYLHAATGLANKPMFNIKTTCDLNKITLKGSTLAGYGANAGENGITFDTTANLYSEITDIIFDTFKIGIADLKGVNPFVFNYVLENCGTGIQVNYSTAAIETTLDVEVGTIKNCAICIDLLKATAGNFIIDQNVFINPSGGISIKYTGGAGNFILANTGKGVLNITSNSYNNTGEFLSGFDFTNSRDADVEIISNIGEEDKSPHAKINVRNNATATTITTANTYYKLNFTNTSTYSCKMTLANNKMTYQSYHEKDAMIILNGNISVNQTNRNLEVALRKGLHISSVTGNGATVTVTCSDDHGLFSGTLVQMLSWTGGTGTWNGVYTITVTSSTTFTYSATGNGTATGGNSGALLSPFTVRTATSGQPYQFSIVIYADDVHKDDDFEIYGTSTSNGDQVTIQDLTWFFKAQ